MFNFSTFFKNRITEYIWLIFHVKMYIDWNECKVTKEAATFIPNNDIINVFSSLIIYYNCYKRIYNTQYTKRLHYCLILNSFHLPL